MPSETTTRWPFKQASTLKSRAQHEKSPGEFTVRHLREMATQLKRMFGSRHGEPHIDDSPEHRSNEGKSTTQAASKISLPNTLPVYLSSEGTKEKSYVRRFLGALKSLRIDLPLAQGAGEAALPQQEITASNQEVLTEDDSIYSLDDDGSEDEFDRRDFETIRAIPSEVIKKLVLNVMQQKHGSKPWTCFITHRKEGSYHHCVFLRVELHGVLEQEYVLKIPAHGTPKNWQYPEDAIVLKNEAQLMQRIMYATKCPLPEVVDFHPLVNNDLGAPYILLKKIPGSSAEDMWHGKPLKELRDEDSFLTVDDTPPELEQKRINFLQSLARAMSHLQKLQFEKIGTPIFGHCSDEKPKLDCPIIRWHSKTRFHEFTRFGPFLTSASFFVHGVNISWNPLAAMNDMTPEQQQHPKTHQAMGVRRLLQIIFSQAPFRQPSDISDPHCDTLPAKEPFVLRHDDLDLHNILVDDDGNVTGILDWDGCMAVPQCIGYASIPLFLHRDWLPNFTMLRQPCITWELDKYRSVYADAMEEAHAENVDGGLPTGAKYTRKSPMYQALLAALYEDAGPHDVLDKLLGELEEFRRVDREELYERLPDWPAVRDVLEAELLQLLSVD
ncbi:hypothetical protein ACN47E_002266 [Coniothyrium glycines]